MRKIGLLLVANISDPGLADNASGVPKVAAFSTVHEGERGGLKTVGALVGMETENIAKETIFQAHHVHSPAFGAPPLRRRAEAATLRRQTSASRTAWGSTHFAAGISW
eukprot:4542818-Pleurochrysis_carterae.AAC.1